MSYPSFFLSQPGGEHFPPPHPPTRCPASPQAQKQRSQRWAALWTSDPRHNAGQRLAAPLRRRLLWSKSSHTKSTARMNGLRGHHHVFRTRNPGGQGDQWHPQLAPRDSWRGPRAAIKLTRLLLGSSCLQGFRTNELESGLHYQPTPRSQSRAF